MNDLYMFLHETDLWGWDSGWLIFKSTCTYCEADLWGWAGAAVFGLSSSFAFGAGLFFSDLFILSSNRLWSLSFSYKQ